MKKEYNFQNRMLVAFIVIFSMLLLTAGEKTGRAENFPNKPVSLLVPFAAGSGLDLEVRLIQPYFQKHLGARVVISNIPGADRKIGLTKAYKASPDGYTLISPGWPMPIGEMNFNPHRFTYIGAWTRSNFVLVVNSETWKDMKDFVSAAKKRKLNCGVSNVAGMARILGEILLDEAGISEVNWVVYPGSADAMAQLAGKHLDFIITTNSSARGLVRAGKIRPIMVFSKDADDVFPDAPLAKDLGYKVPSLSTIRLLLAPPNTPAERVAIIEQALFKAANDPDYRRIIKERGMHVYLQNHEELREELEASYPVIDKYLAKIGFKAVYKD